MSIEPAASPDHATPLDGAGAAQLDASTPSTSSAGP